MAKKADIQDIKRDAEKAEGEAEKPLDETLKKRLDKVDLLIADLGQVNEFNVKSQEFVDAATEEIKQNTRSRKHVLCAAGLIIFALAITIVCLLFDHDFDEVRNDPTAFTTILGISIGGIIVLMMSITKAVFSRFSERNEGVPMPSQLKEVINTLQDYIDKS